nr:MAG TPA: hypothetical protein [Bacteriophage sp.]
MPTISLYIIYLILQNYYSIKIVCEPYIRLLIVLVYNFQQFLRFNDYNWL